ncbi:hypothetical protein BST81_20810 [Leptolyngbya sp. 'hensonii']|uniref:hypothetical protein n=1 Tax=Leptolyngbya sp. 'hensonii' TaxID=1922337 RepID=UPI00094FEDE8|nr:hypothetical protein [Leptolyngbya sp. 'hensonii']OLP16426.1 hypothetical protein BST81_20810 [Leptolyngbya sp. 'hensonii']
MARQLKRWESPRKEGRNSKGKGGSARQRQVRKQTQVLRQRLKEQGDANSKSQRPKGGEGQSSPLIFCQNLSLDTPVQPGTTLNAPDFLQVREFLLSDAKEPNLSGFQSLVS